MNQRIFRYTSDKAIHEYRFVNNICVGVFYNDEEVAPNTRHYKGRELTELWEKHLTDNGFIEVK